MGIVYLHLDVFPTLTYEKKVHAHENIIIVLVFVSYKPFG